MIKYCISTIIFVLLTFIQVAAQSKKKQIVKLNKCLDSLNRELTIEKKLTMNLDYQLTNTKETLQKKELELNNTNIKLQNNNGKILDLTNEIHMLKDSIKKLTSKRDFSNGTFNDNELNYIINFFKRELKNIGEEEKQSISIIDSSSVIVHQEGELGYVPCFTFDKNFNKLLAGDLDHDGTQEILFNVWVTGGGTAVWGEIYCLKIISDNKYLLFNIDVPCACSENYSCREPNVAIQKVQDNILTIENQCFLNSDANCCPSLIFSSKFKFQNTNLILIE